jgi:uncharacterized protein with von Willebrand factor type A (vWA) domain
VPDLPTAAVAFARVLRGAGLDVPIGAVTTYVRALEKVGVDSRDRVYWAGRATLVAHHEDVATYDAAFDAFWLERRGIPLRRQVEHVVLALDDDGGAESPGDGSSGEQVPAITLRYSPREVLRTKDFAAYSSDEFDEARRLMADVRLAGALRRSRRLRPSRRRDGHPDLRRTVRRALRTGGEPVRRAYLAPSQRPRRVVLVCDVSGSMDPYARALLRFLQAAVAGRSRVEAFALGTRLTRITKELSSRDPDAALQRAAKAVADWSGGTRLGEGLRRFNDTWGVRGFARGAVVVIMSDGWDRGDPAALAEQMARLRRVAHRIVWVNPLKSSPGYAPLARGMAAALPYVDDFVEGHSVESLEKLVEVIGK